MSIESEKKIIIIFGFVCIFILTTILVANAQTSIEADINHQSIAVDMDKTKPSTEKNMDFVTWLDTDIPASLMNTIAHFQSNYLTIDIHRIIEGSGMLKIIDQKGNIMRKARIAKGYQTFQINIKNLPKGKYEVEFQDTMGTLSSSFQKRN